MAALGDSQLRLRNARAALGPGDGFIQDMIDLAIDADARTVRKLGDRRVPATSAAKELELAWFSKATAHGNLAPPSPQNSHCADGVDNDGDRMVDSRHDSACTDAADASEASPSLSCTLGYKPAKTLSGVQGACSGPFGKIQITTPSGLLFYRSVLPSVRYSEACFYSSPRTLDCLMKDGLVNPQHVVSVSRLRYNLPPRRAARFKLKVTVSDFLRRGTAVNPGTPPAERPFSLGPNPVNAVGTFTNGRGGCGFATSFMANFLFLVPGDGAITISQGSQIVTGTITAKGAWQARSAIEAYGNGQITGDTATAAYSHSSPNGCVMSYNARFALRR